MGDPDASQVREFTTTPAMEAIDILWLTAGLGCDGDSIATTGATQPSIEDVGALVFVLDREGRIVRFNRACELMTGQSFEQARGQRVWDLFLAPEEKQ